MSKTAALVTLTPKCESALKNLLGFLRAMIDGLRHESPSEVVAVFSHHCFIGHVTGVWPANCQIVPAEGW